MTSSPDLVTQTEAAEILNVHESTVSRWSDTRNPERKLAVVQRFGQVKCFHRADVEALRAQLDADKTSA